MFKSAVKLKERDDLVGIIESVTYVPGMEEPSEQHPQGKAVMVPQIAVCWMQQNEHGEIVPCEEACPSFHYPAELQFLGLVDDIPGLIWAQEIDDEEEEEEEPELDEIPGHAQNIRQ